MLISFSDGLVLLITLYISLNFSYYHPMTFYLITIFSWTTASIAFAKAFYGQFLSVMSIELEDCELAEDEAEDQK